MREPVQHVVKQGTKVNFAFLSRLLRRTLFALVAAYQYGPDQNPFLVADGGGSD
jgi:hypothetical protein